MADQYNPEVSLTIFPRVNFLKTFATRFSQRVANGRIYGDVITPEPPAELTLDAPAIIAQPTPGALVGTTAQWHGGDTPTSEYAWAWLGPNSQAYNYVTDWEEYPMAEAISVPYTPTQSGTYRFICRASNEGISSYEISYSGQQYVTIDDPEP